VINENYTGETPVPPSFPLRPSCLLWWFIWRVSHRRGRLCHYRKCTNAPAFCGCRHGTGGGGRLPAGDIWGKI